MAVAINQQRPPLPADMPPGLASLITSCWEEDPRARPPVAALLDTLDRLIQVSKVQAARCKKQAARSKKEEGNTIHNNWQAQGGKPSDAGTCSMVF